MAAHLPGGSGVVSSVSGPPLIYLAAHPLGDQPRVMPWFRWQLSRWGVSLGRCRRVWFTAHIFGSLSAGGPAQGALGDQSGEVPWCLFRPLIYLTAHPLGGQPRVVP
ncbi:hypothetical protein PIB30_011255 [Stylosanthes scabra]|uniref:Uncharacterized protein n=1 Tax=Stylosanthes scabra TaxID=79078 RepID=A0ABU6U5Z1_9FABA|nr:hypothetical protein [Stylosanthes scabra]